MAYERRISNWSSVVCSSDLLVKLGHIIARKIDMGSGEEPSITVGEGVRPAAVIIGFGRVGRLVADMLRVHNQPFVAVESDIDTVAQARRDGYQIGRASCRERVCQYV